MRDIVKNDVTA